MLTVNVQDVAGVKVSNVEHKDAGFGTVEIQIISDRNEVFSIILFGKSASELLSNLKTAIEESQTKEFRH